MKLNLPFFNPTISFVVKPLPSPLPPPPQGLQRHLLGPHGRQLEVLSAHPPPGTPVHGVLVLQHGGFGSALCWKYFLPFLAARGYHAYAPSLRGHGLSWRPSFLGQFFTTKDTLAREDLGSAVAWVRKQHSGQGIALVGHSAGGGLSQYATQQGYVGHLRKLVLMAAFPPQGGLGVRSTPPLLQLFHSLTLNLAGILELDGSP
jgi:pimeloyl-ACP methyl ester carboxylesterase